MTMRAAILALLALLVAPAPLDAQATPPRRMIRTRCYGRSPGPTGPAQAG